MAHKQLAHFEHHRREMQLTSQRFRVTLLLLFVGLFVTLGLQFRGSFAASTPEISSGIAGKCLEDAGGSTADRTAVVIDACNGSTAQQWVETGSLVKIFGKCLDVIKAGTANGTKVELFTCNAGNNQSWTYTGGVIKGVGSGKCLDDPSSSTTNGTQLQIFTCNGTAAQQWHVASFTVATPAPTPVKTPVPTPAPTPKPVATPTPVPVYQMPSPDPGDSGGSGDSPGDDGSGDSGSGGGAADPGTTAGGGSTAATPNVPGGFSALVSGTNAVIDLSWQASSDMSGIASYQLDQSLDQNTWTSVSATITGTAYSDKNVNFGIHYYYRLKALDNDGNSSDYAYIDATTPDFASNAGTDNSTTYTSDDKLATVMLPTGAVDGDADCSVTTDPSHAYGTHSQPLVAGPFALVCKDSDGNVETGFNKPLTWTFNLKSKLKGLSNPLAYATDDSGAITPIKNGKFNSAHSTLTFTSTTTNSVLVLAAVSPGIPWSLVIAILLAIGAVGGVLVLILRHKQKSNYDDYLRSKYYNL